MAVPPRDHADRNCLRRVREAQDHHAHMVRFFVTARRKTPPKRGRVGYPTVAKNGPKK
jgi:hypothetical protein